MTIKEIKKEAQNYIEANNINKNTYQIEKAFIDGAKKAKQQINKLNITDVSVFVCSKNTNYSECEEMQIGGNCKECEFLINKR